MNKHILILIVLGLLGFPLASAQNRTIAYGRFSNEIKAGDSMVWQITDIELDPLFYGEMMGIEYPAIEIGSNITVNILKDVGALEIKEDSLYDPNEYFEEFVDGVKVPFRNQDASPRIYVETSFMDENHTMNGYHLGTTEVISPSTFVYSEYGETSLVKYYRSLHSPFVSVGGGSRTFTVTSVEPFGDHIWTTDIATGIILNGTISVSGPTGPRTIRDPIHVSFELIAYEGGAYVLSDYPENGYDIPLDLLYLALGAIIIRIMILRIFDRVTKKSIEGENPQIIPSNRLY